MRRNMLFLPGNNPNMLINANCLGADAVIFDLEDAVSPTEKDAARLLVRNTMRYMDFSGCETIVRINSVDLGATEFDTDFNVNVHTDSNGYIMGGSGGHSDTAAGAKLAMIIAPMFRARLPIVTDRVKCISTPGKDIDVLVTQGGIAVNPKNVELKEKLINAGLPVIDIKELKKKTERITDTPEMLSKGDKVVAEVIGRNGEILDKIYNVL